MYSSNLVTVSDNFKLKENMVKFSTHLDCACKDMTIMWESCGKWWAIIECVPKKNVTMLLHMHVGNISIKSLYNTKKTCIIYTTIPKIFTDTAKALSSPWRVLDLPEELSTLGEGRVGEGH